MLIGEGLVLLSVGVALGALELLAGRGGPRGGVSWFDLPLVPLNRAERRRARSIP